MVKPQGKEMKMQWMTVDGRRTPIILPQIWDHEKEDWVVTSTENPLPTQVTGSNVEVIFSETDFVCPANSHKRLEDVNVADFKEFFIHFIPGGLSNYEIHYYIKRPSGSTLTRSMVEKRTSASNGMTDRFIMNSITASISFYNETDDYHVFSEIYLFGVRT